MTTVILPGLIDPHVHLRDPGQTQKEDFYTGTAAALAGGFTTVLDMPNNKAPITTEERINEKIALAAQKIVSDVGFYFGSQGDNLNEFGKVRGKVLGLKLFLNETTGKLTVNSYSLQSIFTSWKKSQSIALHSSILSSKMYPVLVHAEDKKIEDVISVVQKVRIPTHFCHVSTREDLVLILRAKESGLPITCGVTPHHLFLTEHDQKSLGPFGKMKPPLAKKEDVEFLWKNLRYIDVIESDHAPHTINEKIMRVASAGDPHRAPAVNEVNEDVGWGKSETGPAAPFGVPGLETTLPLLLAAVSEGKLTIDDIILLCHTNPAKIFGVPINESTKVEVDLSDSYTIDNRSLRTKCSWSPFNGWKVKGKVKRVFIRGTKVFEDGNVLVKPGHGKVAHL